MRQLEEQIRVLVEESVMRKRRRIDHPQAAASTPASTAHTPGGRVQSGQAKRVRKSQPQGGAASASRAKKPKEPVATPVPPVQPVAAPVPVRKVLFILLFTLQTALCAKPTFRWFSPIFTFARVKLDLPIPGFFVY